MIGNVTHGHLGAAIGRAGAVIGLAIAAVATPAVTAADTVEATRVLALSDDVAYGEYLAGECAGCHSGSAVGAVPVIAGLPADYAVLAMLQYRDGTRDNTTMGGIAAALGDEEIAVLGHYLASLVPAAGDGATAEEATPAAAVPDASGIDAVPEVEVGIRPDLPNVTVSTSDGDVVIERVQDPDNVIEGDFARTSRPCPPFCIQPITPVEGVATIGELELLELLQDPDATVLDSRELDWHLEGTIPGATSLPYTEIASRLDELGCTGEPGRWDCSGARTVALFCNGAWCGQSPTAIRAMVREGFPPERIRYYRAGMQGWRILGLTVVEGDF